MAGEPPAANRTHDGSDRSHSGSRGFGFSDITRATAYFKNRADIPALAAWCLARGLRSLPFIAARCGICRNDLLFELEADAWNAKPAV